MNPDGTYTLAEAAQKVAMLKTFLGAPYKIALCMNEDAPNISIKNLRPALPVLSRMEFKDLTSLLQSFREYYPKGNWLMMLRGKTVGFKSPLGAIDTQMIEKAIKYHTENGHEGEI